MVTGAIGPKFHMYYYQHQSDKHHMGPGQYFVKKGALFLQVMSQKIELVSSGGGVGGPVFISGGRNMILKMPNTCLSTLLSSLSHYDIDSNKARLLKNDLCADAFKCTLLVSHFNGDFRFLERQ